MDETGKDIYYMKLALREAAKGRGFTKTNPLVGTVIVKDNQVISRGYHKCFGEHHAEINALRKAGHRARGADMYVTLEPCSTTMKTPPCTDAILKAGIKRVIIAEYDPNLANGRKGVKILEENGIEVIPGVLEREAGKINEFFHVAISKKRPFITLKLALSLDGKIGVKGDCSKWITNETARAQAHKLRHDNDAVLVGKNTALADNPYLTVRSIKPKRQPDRIVLDLNGEVPLDKNVFAHPVSGERIFIVLSESVGKSRLKQYENRGIITIICKGKDDMENVFRDFLNYQIGTILVEGGGIVAGNLLKHKLIDKMILFYGSLVIGSHEAVNSFSSYSITDLSQTVKLENMVFRKIEDNFMITGSPNYK